MIILDLDNCIADDAWRIPRIDWTKKGDKRYHNYHLLAPFDEMCNTSLFTARDCEIIIATARPRKYEAATIEWLRRNGVDYSLLLMRENNDITPSVQLKRSMAQYILNRSVATKPSDILCAYDDRQDIVGMYRSLGINAEVRAIHNVCAYTPPKENCNGK